jgi:periplasmic divalent cation tolerance protein
LSVISVYAIFANLAEAEGIGRAMVEERLAACVNILGPVHSIYRWKGAIDSAEEVAAIFKTSDRTVERLIARVTALHSYDIPCLASWPIDKILGTYADWVEDSVA